jgi:hypothetical protein
MAKKSTPEKIQTVVEPASNQNFRGRIVFKSGGTQDLLVVATTTNVFSVIQQEYQKYLAGGASANKWTTVGAPNWTITIFWPDVSALYLSID